MPANPLAIRSRTCAAVSASITGGPGIAISVMAKSGCPTGPTVSQRKPPISGSVTSERISIPSLRV